jgi:hypothetical protein
MIVESPDVYWARVLSDVLVDPEAPSLVSYAAIKTVFSEHRTITCIVTSC